jgi:ATP-dependent Clp protease ATP-binding subunit ClpA
VKVLAREYYGDEKALIKIDMSEFSERHSGSKLIGTTAGFVGFEEGGMLTEKVSRKPYSVVLFDEIEKGNTEIFNLLLQIMEDGVISDGKGRKVNFKNTIIVMTSNIGSEEFTTNADKNMVLMWQRQPRIELLMILNRLKPKLSKVSMIISLQNLSIVLIRSLFSVHWIPRLSKKSSLSSSLSSRRDLQNLGVALEWAAPVVETHIEGYL